MLESLYLFANSGSLHFAASKTAKKEAVKQPNKSRSLENAQHFFKRSRAMSVART